MVESGRATAEGDMNTHKPWLLDVVLRTPYHGTMDTSIHHFIIWNTKVYYKYMIESYPQMSNVYSVRSIQIVNTTECSTKVLAPS